MNSNKQGCNDEEQSAEYYEIKELHQKKQTFLSFINGDTMKKVLAEVHAHIQNGPSESFALKPLNKELHLKLKEVAINYEIALELKSKQLEEMRQDKSEEAKKLSVQKKEIQDEIDKNWMVTNT